MTDPIEAAAKAVNDAWLQSSPEKIARTIVGAYLAASPDLYRQAWDNEFRKCRRFKGGDGLCVQCTGLLDDLIHGVGEEPELCGSWGGCDLPKGHNRGRADVPANHNGEEPE